ncbi:MAG: tyrosine-protein kinase family protein [Tepidisphaeraceae bacterium]
MIALESPSHKSVFPIPTIRSNRNAVAMAMTVHLDPRSDAANAFQSLAGDLLPPGVVAITAESQGKGCTTVACNLALAAAKAGRSVLLIDANLPRPILHRIFHLSDGSGLSISNARAGRLEWLIQPTGVERLDVLCAAEPTNECVCDLPEFAAFLGRIRHRFDHVLIDAPPPAADALRGCCDRILLLKPARGWSGKRRCETHIARHFAGKPNGLTIR